MPRCINLHLGIYMHIITKKYNVTYNFSLTVFVKFLESIGNWAIELWWTKSLNI